MPQAKLTKAQIKEIEEVYDSAEFRLTQERSDFLLPQITDFVEGKKWLMLRPEYQRRLVWDKKKKSRFIESLLMNIPVPQIFLYETDYSRYEVMDGQQRLNTIVEFYRDGFPLAGLEHWPLLNGLKYSDFPTKLQRGLDRRRMSATVILTESAKDLEQARKVKEYVFERLNTGGISLNAQELRNCLYLGEYNDLIVELAGYPLFSDMLGVPRYDEYIRGDYIHPKLAENKIFSRMRDCELVLRFFSLRKKSAISSSLKLIMDRNMEKNMGLSTEGVQQLREVFHSRLNLANEIFGESAFRDEHDRKVLDRFYDAIMVALDRGFEERGKLIKNSKKISQRIMELKEKDEYHDLIIGTPNSANGIKSRINVIEEIFSAFL
jgi:Protein of unknown function DUF262